METTKKQTQTYETWLPDFPGFYESLYAFNYADIEWILFDNPNSIEKEYLNWLLNNLFDYVNNEDYENDVAKEYTKQWFASAKEQIDYIESIKYQKTNSPRFYNYSTDYIDITIKIDIDRLVFDFATTEGAAKYIKEKYSCRSGFISHYDNDISTWIKNLDDNLEHKIGSMLNFIVNIDELDIYSDVFDDISPYVYINIDKLIADFNEHFDMNIKALSELET